jgi:Aminoglycoside-2''-adenylyltransferase
VSETAAVEGVVATLAAEGLDVWLFGGWAEELLGLAEPWPHGDVDLLYVAQDFDALDELIERRRWELVKDLPHKRAIRLHDVTVDLFLVRRDEEGYFTEFDGQRHSWPDDVVDDRAPLPIASRQSVGEFREAFRRLLELR